MESLVQGNDFNLRDAHLLRIVDANLNRLREGLRVVEDILRYGFDSQKFAIALKNLRHKCKIDYPSQLLESRDSIKDVLKESTQDEQKRENLQQIFLANFKRAQESARVLEEILKLEQPQMSAHFKDIRYTLYALEKDIFSEIFAKEKVESHER